MDTVSLLLTFIAGVIAGVLGGIILIYLQFLRSTGKHRVELVSKATKDFFADNRDTTMLRNKNRYSLGVIIDEMVQCFGRNDFDPEGNWPVIAEDQNEKGEKIDRWGRFNEYIRPVIDDINPYSFLGGFRIFRVFRWLNELHILTKLCNQLELVVAELDAVFEANLVTKQKTGISPTPNGRDDPRITDLREAYRQLHQVWQQWLQISGLGT